MLFVLLFINITLGLNVIEVDYTTSIYKNNKLYVYESKDNELGWSGLTIYYLEDGPISDIQTQLVNITNSSPIYTPQFLQLPQGLPNGRSNEIWLIGGIEKDQLKDKNLSKENWSCEILNDSELKFHEDFIPMPPFKNFPKSGFSQTIVNNNNGPEIYIIGGLVYSKELDTSLITNYFYKYEFNTGKWVDLNKATKSILQPRAFHKVIEVDNSLLLFGGIQNNEAIKRKFEHTAPINDDADLGDITTILKFDLRSQKWSTVNTKLNKDPIIYKNVTAEGSSFDVYNGKIISYVTLANYEDEFFEPQIGVLDYNTWEWEWHDVKTVSGIDNSLSISYYQTLIINHQLILIHGMSNQRQDNKLYAVNLETYTFQGSINITSNYTKQRDLGLPGWSVAIAVLSSILLVNLLIGATWFYLCYKKRVKVDDINNEIELHELWASTYRENEKLKLTIANFSSKNTGNTGGFNDTILNEGSIVHYECFQHNVDLEDLEITKAEL